MFFPSEINAAIMLLHQMLMEIVVLDHSQRTFSIVSSFHRARNTLRSKLTLLTPIVCSEMCDSFIFLVSNFKPTYYCVQLLLGTEIHFSTYNSQLFKNIENKCPKVEVLFKQYRRMVLFAKNFDHAMHFHILDYFKKHCYSEIGAIDVSMLKYTTANDSAQLPMFLVTDECPDFYFCYTFLCLCSSGSLFDEDKTFEIMDKSTFE